MRRLLWLVPLALLLAALWLFGRPPARFLLEESAARFQEERRAQERNLAAELRTAESLLQAATRPEERARLAAAAAEVRARREALLLRHETLTLRGWEVRILPPGAGRPDPREFVALEPYDPSGAEDPAPLAGPHDFWVAPRGPLARLLSRLGLNP
ncbi:MAG: hypothetical protein ACT4PV_03010 [Planctomycetaceae bacterium]